jgi:hypothetical protein
VENRHILKRALRSTWKFGVVIAIVEAILMAASDDLTFGLLLALTLAPVTPLLYLIQVFLDHVWPGRVQLDQHSDILFILTVFFYVSLYAVIAWLILYLKSKK